MQLQKYLYMYFELSGQKKKIKGEKSNFQSQDNWKLQAITCTRDSFLHAINEFWPLPARLQVNRLPRKPISLRPMLPEFHGGGSRDGGGWSRTNAAPQKQTRPVKMIGEVNVLIYSFSEARQLQFGIFQKNKTTFHCRFVNEICREIIQRM